jgi:Uma2 family endonuclease
VEVNRLILHLKDIYMAAIEVIQREERKITVKELFEMELEEGFFYELINGNIVKKQAPAPAHQNASMQIATAMNNFIKERQLGKLFAAPIDVFFDDHNNTQPDILFVKKERDFLITKHGIEGAPDLIVEILSPSTFKVDRKDKFDMYLFFGVSEYWIVDPKNQSIEVYILENDRYKMEFFAIENGLVQSKVLDGLNLEVSEIFG